MAKKKQGEPVFRPGAARQLLEGGWAELTDDERALLLALIGVDTEAGVSLDEEQRAALDKVMAEMEGYDVEELARAVRHIVTAESREGQKLEWPELKREVGKRRSSRE